MSWLALGAVALLFSGCVLADDVVTVTGETSFNEVLKKNDFVVMEFYAPVSYFSSPRGFHVL